LLSPGIGRINCIALHPTDSNILFVGTACGGIWRSIDGGVNWASSNDALPSMSITDISINPLNPDTIYAATGDAPGNWVFDTGWNFFFPGGHYACGILMSTDGGQTWNQTGLTYSQAQTLQRAYTGLPMQD
jgi:xyloglucan-specific exo-beta-1,4-glucanase